MGVAVLALAHKMELVKHAPKHGAKAYAIVQMAWVHVLKSIYDMVRVIVLIKKRTIFLPYLFLTFQV